MNLPFVRVVSTQPAVPLARVIRPLFAGAILFASSACSLSGGNADAHPAPVAQPVPAVPIAHAETGDIARVMKIPGSVRAEAEVVLHAKTNGFVKSISKDRGDHVTVGETIAVIDIPELSVERDSAVAALALSDATLKRLDSIHTLEKTAVTDQDLDVERAKHATADAAVKRIDTLLGYAVVKAPFDGVVSERFVDPGALVQQGSIVTVIDVARVRVLVDVPESEMRWVKVGTTAEIKAEAAPGKAITASVARMASALEVTTRTLRVELDRTNADLALLPGMYVSVALELERHRNVVLVPSKAVVLDQGKPVIFSLTDGKATKIAVTTGITDGTKTEIMTGLTDTQVSIIAVGLGMKDGMRVQPAEAK